MTSKEKINAITNALDSREIVFLPQEDGSPSSTPIEVCTIAGKDRDKLKEELVKLIKEA